MTLDLVVNVEKAPGVFRYKEIGQEVAPGKKDQVILNVELKMANFGKETSRVFRNSFPIANSLVDDYLDSEVLKVKRRELDRQNANLDCLEPPK